MNRAQSYAFLHIDPSSPTPSLAPRETRSQSQLLFNRIYAIHPNNNNSSTTTLPHYATLASDRYPTPARSRSQRYRCPNSLPPIRHHAKPHPNGSPTRFVGTYPIHVPLGRSSPVRFDRSQTDEHYRFSRCRSASVHQQRTSSLSFSSPSIVTSVALPSGSIDSGLVNPSRCCCCCCSYGNQCPHHADQWEDCHVWIQCFGLGRQTRSRKGVGVRTTSTAQVDGQPPITNRPWDKEGQGITAQEWRGRKSGFSTHGKNIPVRSVRLSIVPLCPIYRRSRTRVPVHLRDCSRTQNRSVGHKRSANPTVSCSCKLFHAWYKRLLQKMAFKIDDFTIQEDQVKTAKDVFNKFDKRSQNKISTTDLGPAFRALNLKVKPDALKEWADEVDDDATGFIDFNGFLTCYGKSLQEEQDERDLRDAFRVLDKNKKGEIDTEDLRWILKELGDDLTEEEIDDMIRDTDTDGSGFVDFDEFYKLMTSE